MQKIVVDHYVKYSITLVSYIQMPLIFNNVLFLSISGGSKRTTKCLDDLICIMQILNHTIKIKFKLLCYIRYTSTTLVWPIDSAQMRCLWNKLEFSECSGVLSLWSHWLAAHNLSNSVVRLKILSMILYQKIIIKVKILYFIGLF